MSDLIVANPSPTELDVIERQADALARSSIVPPDYRGKAANIIAAALMGRSFGWDATTSMRMITVISGTAGLKPEAMLALIRQRGHHVTVKPHDDGRGVTVHGKRADNGDTASATFTLADAERAGLTRSSAWKSYPVDMCQWRAVARLARQLFGDVVLGAGYTAEELGAEPDVAAPVVVAPVVDTDDDDVVDAEVVDDAPAYDATLLMLRIPEARTRADCRALWSEAKQHGVLEQVGPLIKARADELPDDSAPAANPAPSATPIPPRFEPEVVEVGDAAAGAAQARNALKEARA